MSSGEVIRIGLVAPTMDILGGHAVQAARLLAGWRADPEIQIALFPINPPPPPILAPLSKLRLLRTLITQALYWPLLLRRVPRVHALHVFCPSNRSFFLSALPALVVARWYGKPVVVNHRGDGGERLASSATMRRLLASATVSVAPSSYFRDIVRELGIPSRIIPNLCDPEQFTYRARDPLRPALLSTRNLEPIYNVACTVRAFALVQAKYPDASLVLVGEGSQRKALEALVRALKLRHVTFAGRVPHSEIHRFYDSADIYVQTPVMDNMPGSVVEAFACGLPVVATRVGGVPALVTDGVHGRLAPSDDHAAVAAGVIALLESPDQARSMAAAALATCQQYTWPPVGEQWRAVYREITGGVRHD